MSAENAEPVDPERSGPALGMAAAGIRVLLPVLLVLGGWWGFTQLSKKKPPPTVPRPVSKPTEVRVMELKREDYQVTVRAQGEIRAHSQVGLTAQVSGRVMTVFPEFEEGAFFKEGDVLLELDPIDFQDALVAADAQLAQAQLSLEQEKIRAEQARLDWEDLGYKKEPSDFVLRKPQVALAEKQVALAEAQKLTAQRNLDRAKVRAPFDGRVLTRSAGVGQTIGGSTPLGEIFATDYSEVRLPVSTRFLGDIALPEDVTDPHLEIRLKDGLVQDSEVEWDAKILRTEGALDADTLELFAIARIEDPYGLQSEKVPLRVGQPVAADIPGRTLEGVFVIPREAVSGLSRIRLVDPESRKLASAQVVPLWSDDTYLVFHNDEIPDGMLLVMTGMVYAPDGGTVEIVEDELPEGAEEAAGESTGPEGTGGTAKK